MLLNGDSGWINSRLKNIREAKNKLNKKKTSMANEHQIIEQLSDADAETELALLKTITVDSETMTRIIQKLNSTRTYRHKLLLDKEINLKEWFPFFFTHPKLVRDLFL